MGIAAELRQLGQADLAGQDPAVGEARLSRQIGRRQRRVKVAKAFEGRQQQAVGDRGIGDAGAGIGGEPGGLQGTYGGQPLVVVLLAKQG
ncbi:hypothetical protein D3C72_2143330 [compost metagenome]